MEQGIKATQVVWLRSVVPKFELHFGLLDLVEIELVEVAEIDWAVGV